MESSAGMRNRGRGSAVQAGMRPIRPLLRAAGAVLVASPVLAAAPAAFASCIPLTEAQQTADAQVIFEGVALDGPRSGEQLVSPVGFRVTRYLKGSGPEVVRVEAGVHRAPDGTFAVTSVDILPKPGEAWRIYGQGAAESGAGIIATSQCAGSRLLRAAGLREPPPPADGRAATGAGTGVWALAGVAGLGLVMLVGWLAARSFQRAR